MSSIKFCVLCWLVWNKIIDYVEGASSNAFWAAWEILEYKYEFEYEQEMSMEYDDLRFIAS